MSSRESEPREEEEGRESAETGCLIQENCRRRLPSICYANKTLRASEWADPRRGARFRVDAGGKFGWRRR